MVEPNRPAWQAPLDQAPPRDGPENPFYKKKVVFSHRKDLNVGDFLVDDRPTMRGADRFAGELLHFGGERFQDWGAVVEYLEVRA